MALSPTVARRALVLATLVAWEVLPRVGVIPELFLPPLSKTLAAGVGDWQEYLHELVTTLSEVAVAMLIACGGGIAVGAVVGSVASLRNFMLPLLGGLYAVPLVILYPVLTVWLGIGPPSKVAFATFLGILPAILSTAAGIRTVDEQLVLAARSMGASLPQRIVRVVIPAAIPAILEGVRIGGALTIVGVVVAEMLVSAAGVGYLITRYRALLDSAHVFAAILLVVAIVVGFDALVRVLERKTAVWRTASHAPATVEQNGKYAAPTMA